MDTEAWQNVYITDKSGRRMWNTTVSPMASGSEIRNMKKRLESAAKHPTHYPTLDLATAVIMVDGEPLVEMSVDELLAELFA